MYFKPYYLGCLSHASYLIGGDNGDAAVIDPRRDVDEYIADASEAGLNIRHVIETHLHADFVSGHVELAKRTGAKIYIGAKAEAKFIHKPIHEGDGINLGDVTLRFLETPGHTPEGITILAEVAGKATPPLAFTGDTLFIGDVGRPDLLDSKGITPEDMAGQMYYTLKDKLLTLPDETEVWPAHGAGSSCGRALSNDRVSTIGKEKSTNPALKYVISGDKEGFIRYSVDGLAIAPSYFKHDVEKNREGAVSIEAIISAAKALSPPEVEELSEVAALVLDTRSSADFGAGHVPGAINIQLEGNFATWAGSILSPEMPVVIVADLGFEIEAMTRLARVGYEKFAGWLDGGMEAWKEAGGETATLEQLTASELRHMLKSESDSVRVLDVRTLSEWEAGHIEGAIHIPLIEIESRMSEIPTGEIAVICGSGYRSTIACSLLQRTSCREIKNVIGGWAAWINC